MAETRWTHWTTVLEWSPDVAPAVQARLGAFLDLVLHKLATLAAHCNGGNSVDVIVALSGYVQQLDPVSAVNERIEIVRQQAMAVAHEGQVRTWTAIVTDLLDGDARPIQWATSALLLERLLRAARLSRAEWGDRDVLVTAADGLELEVRHLLTDVLQYRIPSTSYRLM
jgi:hypothetical protein